MLVSALVTGEGIHLTVSLSLPVILIIVAWMRRP